MFSGNWKFKIHNNHNKKRIMVCIYSMRVDIVVYKSFRLLLVKEDVQYFYY